jgi:mRNA-degrading endonuclease HigB of HigAB toxin-antitoxin module
MSYKLNLKNPKTFNEKLNWSKLSDRKSQYTRMADKYQVKEYVKKIIGEEYVVPCFGV